MLNLSPSNILNGKLFKFVGGLNMWISNLIFKWRSFPSNDFISPSNAWSFICSVTINQSSNIKNNSFSKFDFKVLWKSTTLIDMYYNSTSISSAKQWLNIMLFVSCLNFSYFILSCPTTSIRRKQFFERNSNHYFINVPYELIKQEIPNYCPKWKWSRRHSVVV